MESHEEDGHVPSTSRQPGAQKDFGEHDFARCSGTGMENPARYGENIYLHDVGGLWVNQFIASELNWAAKGLRVRQKRIFPNKGATVLKFSATAGGIDGARAASLLGHEWIHAQAEREET